MGKSLTYAELTGKDEAIRIRSKYFVSLFIPHPSYEELALPQLCASCTLMRLFRLLIGAVVPRVGQHLIQVGQLRENEGPLKDEERMPTTWDIWYHCIDSLMAEHSGPGREKTIE